MKLRIRAEKIGNRARMVLCDENGQILPGQVDTDLSCSLDFGDTITVKFRIDGDAVELVPSS